MKSAIGQTLPLAIAVAISPIPIIAVTLMLVTKRARTNGPLYVLGSVVGLVFIGVIALTVADAAGASDHGQQSTGTNWVLVGLGVLLILAARRHWRRRPRPGDEVEMPKWMRAVDDFGPGKAAGAGFVLQTFNPKNLLLAIGAATTIAATGISGADQAIAYAVFTIIGTIGVATPVIVYFAMGDRAPRLLERLKEWMALHSDAIMATLFLVLGAKVLGDGIGGF